jgi:hypothetical protein
VFAGLAGATLSGTGLVSAILRTEDPYRMALFLDKEGSVFSATDASGQVTRLTLEQVEIHCSGPSTGECFSLEFHGPKSNPLPQGTYRLRHDEMERMDLLLVPVWSDSSVPRYESVINRQIR